MFQNTALRHPVLQPSLVSVDLTCEMNFFSQQKETITESNNESKFRGPLTMNAHSQLIQLYHNTCFQKLRELRKGAERFAIARGPGNWREIVPSCYNREATLMKFQQHGCLSKI